jgi:putative ABC transport system permease protein
MQGMKPTVIGLAIGVSVSLIFARAVANMIYGVSPRDAWTYASVSLLLGLIALLATLVPAWRATRVDPMRTLRDE